MNQYEEIDRMILEAAASNKRTDFISLLFGLAGGEAARIADATGRDQGAILDGRLQALRKRGEIWYDRVSREWRLTASLAVCRLLSKHANSFGFN